MFDETYKRGYLDRYCCEFDFIPNILPSLYSKGEIDDEVMIHPDEWKKILIKKGVRSDFGINKIYVVKNEIDSEKFKFVYTFPKPEKSPDCFYAVLYFENKNNWKYYTLELDIGSSSVFKDGGGIICGQKGANHLNYGRRCKEDLDEFLKSVQDMIDGKPYDIREMYKNIDFNEAAKFGFDDELYKKLGLNPDQVKENCIVY